VRYLPSEGALYYETHDEKGNPTYGAAKPTARTVTSLSGVNLAALYASAEQGLN
jgi:hypothetical protein